jgi:diadenylate cyclase
LIILFQDDIRHVLSRMGKKSFIPGADRVASHHVLDEIVRAATSMASKRIGGLIVLERNIILGRYIDVGVLIDGRISKELLVSIFHPSSPIHDGAVIIQRGRVAAAGCFLPLTREENLDPNMGTRHRAAIGISQETDAVVVLVSEEIGSVTLVVDGKVSRKLDARQLREQLNDLLMGEEEFSDRADSSGGNGSAKGITKAPTPAVEGQSK